MDGQGRDRAGNHKASQTAKHIKKNFCLVVVMVAACNAWTSKAEDWSSQSDAWLLENQRQVIAWSDAVWSFSELAFQEHRSSTLFADTLEKAGFKVQRGVAEMKTAFVAEYGNGTPVIAFLAEYDALPGLSQKADSVRSPRVVGDPGHGCGHNLLGTASLAAGLAVKEVMRRQRLPGKIMVFGTPAEEGGAGKVYMVRAGLFREVDAVLGWHPQGNNRVLAGSCLAVKRARFRFHGLAAHASGSPEKGRSALDAVELMNVGSNYLREHLSSETRIHYIITRGGSRPNIVPEEAEVWYYARAPKMEEAENAFGRLKEIARGACLMTRTEVEVREESGTYETLPNLVLAQMVDRQLRRVGPPPFDAADYHFARQLRGGFGLDTTGVADARILDSAIGEINTKRGMGSTDVGDVSWQVPTIEFGVAANALSIPGHSWGFVATAGGPIGHKALMVASKVLAASALELFANPKQLEPAKKEFRERTRKFVYRSGIPADAKPPARLDD